MTPQKDKILECCEKIVDADIRLSALKKKLESLKREKGVLYSAIGDHQLRSDVVYAGTSEDGKDTKHFLFADGELIEVEYFGRVEDSEYVQSYAGL